MCVIQGYFFFVVVNLPHRIYRKNNTTLQASFRRVRCALGEVHARLFHESGCNDKEDEHDENNIQHRGQVYITLIAAFLRAPARR